MFGTQLLVFKSISFFYNNVRFTFSHYFRENMNINIDLNVGQAKVNKISIKNGTRRHNNIKSI